MPACIGKISTQWANAIGPVKSLAHTGQQDDQALRSGGVGRQKQSRKVFCGCTQAYKLVSIVAELHGLCAENATLQQWRSGAARLLCDIRSRTGCGGGGS